MNTVQGRGQWIRGGIPSRAWVRERGAAGGSSIMANSILVEARRRILLEEREAHILAAMEELRKNAKESR